MSRTTCWVKQKTGLFAPSPCIVTKYISTVIILTVARHQAVLPPSPHHIYVAFCSFNKSCKKSSNCLPFPPTTPTSPSDFFSFCCYNPIMVNSLQWIGPKRMPSSLILSSSLTLSIVVVFQSEWLLTEYTDLSPSPLPPLPLPSRLEFCNQRMHFGLCLASPSASPIPCFFVLILLSPCCYLYL